MGIVAVNGRMVIPVGVGDAQQLLLIQRTEVGFVQNIFEPVRFVPLLAGTQM